MLNNKYKICINKNINTGNLSNSEYSSNALNEKESGAVLILNTQSGKKTVTIKTCDNKSRLKTIMNNISNPKANIDPEVCVDCDSCMNVCPVHAINYGDKPVVDESICTGCGDCVEICPPKAISLIGLNINNIDIKNIKNKLPKGIQSDIEIIKNNEFLNDRYSYIGISYLGNLNNNINSGYTHWGEFVKH